MQYKSHLMLGAVTAAVAVRCDWMALDSLAVPACILGSLLPDMDHPRSYIGKRLQPLSGMIAKIFGHRGITHSLFIIILGAWFLLDYLKSPPHWVTGLALGYLSHLLADFFTPAGVPLLWPLKRKFCSPITVTTGSRQETWLVALIFWGTMAALLYLWLQA